MHAHTVAVLKLSLVSCPLTISRAGGTNVIKGQYRYTEDLLALERASAHTRPLDTASPIAAAEQFLPLDEWSPYLDTHPDQVFAAFIRRGLVQGFRIGFDRSSCVLRPPRGNFQSVTDNPVMVNRYIAEVVAAGRMEVSQSPLTRKNPIGLIPKPHQPGKFRLIVDLSAPRGSSVNDGISLALCSLEYASVDQAARLVARCGKGALMAKTDLLSAYRHVPVHTSDRHLLGIEWEGVTYLDKALPFGLRSAPKLFSAVADSLSWALQCEGITNSVHYLDDFLFWGPPMSPNCEQALAQATSLCTRLGLPVANHKTVGPSTTLTFLGITIDSDHQELRLPGDKVASLKATLSRWERRRSATKRELQVLIGQLNHAAAVVRPGRCFLRQLIDTMKIPHLQSQSVRINCSCRADIMWWSAFIQDWNGIALFPGLPSGPTIISDASGSWGCGAFCTASLNWFQLQWPPHWASTNIAVKELLPIVISAAIWGSSWRGTIILFKSDNQAAVAALTTRAARDPQLSHLLRRLFFLEAHFQFEHRALHVAGRLNTAADALSRNRAADYFRIFPQAPADPTPIPDSLQELVMDSSLSWISPRWKTLFRSTLLRASPEAQEPPTPQPSVVI